MDTLTSQDTHRLLGFLQALYTVRSRAEFTTHLVSAIPTVIASDASGYNEISSRRRVASYQGWPPDHPDIPDAQEILGRYAHQSPLIAHAQRIGDTSAHKITDFVSQRTFRTTTLFNEYYRPLQLHYNMGAKLTPGADPLIAIGLLRSRRDFSSRDIRLMDFMRPHLLQASHNAASVTRMQEQVAASAESLEENRQGLVSVTEEGKIRFAKPLAEQLMVRYDQTAKRNSGCLPPRLRSWLRHEYARQCSESLRHTPSRPLRIDGAMGILTVRLLRQDRQALLLLEETPAQEKRPTLSALGFSPRETEILSWVTQGKTNPEIGMILGISPRTVQKHLEHIYGRLGVENRHAAISLALTASRMARTSGGSD